MKIKTKNNVVLFVSVLIAISVLMFIFSSCTKATETPSILTLTDSSPKLKLISPKNNATEEILLPLTFEWDAFNNTDEGTITYALYVSENNDPTSNPTINATKISTTWYTISPKLLKNDTIYYWKVVAKDSDGEEISSDIYQFNAQWFKWRYNTNLLNYSPSISKDGTIYINGDGYYNGYLYSVNPSGSLKWYYSMGHMAGTSSPVIGSDGTIYVGSYNRCLYAINPNKTLKWQYWVDGEIASTPVIGSDGTIYVSAGSHLYAINPNGKLKWKYNVSTNYSMYEAAIGPDGTIYTGCCYENENYLYAINPDGDLKWTVNLYGPLSNPAIASDGTIYVGGEIGFLYAIDPSGNIKWKFLADGRIYSSPIIGPDGTAYIGCNTGYLYALNPDGSLKWKYKALGNIENAPAIASDGTVYFGSNYYAGNYKYIGYFYAINSDGSLKWKYTMASWSNSSPAIASDGTIYVGCNYGYLYAISTNNRGLADSSWPMFQHDIRHTGRK